MQVGILEITRSQGYYIHLNKEAGFANLKRSSVYTGAIFGLETS